MSELDITAHDATIVRSVRSKKARFKALVDSLPELVYETDLNGKITYANKKAFEFTGLTQKDLDKGVYSFDFFAPSERKRAMKNFKEALEKSTPTYNDYLFVKRDGGLFSLESRVSPLRLVPKQLA